MWIEVISDKDNWRSIVKRVIAFRIHKQDGEIFAKLSDFQLINKDTAGRR